MEEIIKSVHISCKIKFNQLFYFFSHGDQEHWGLAMDKRKRAIGIMTSL